MATILAQATGNWSAPGTWAGGILPGAGGATDNADSNGYTVTIDQDVNLNGGSLIGTSAGAGGFSVTAARAITANVTATVRTVLTASNAAGTVAVTGNVTGGSGIGAIGVNRTAAGALTITGTISGGSSTTAYGLFTSIAGTVTVTGAITGGSGNAAYGIGTSNATVAVTGDVIGGSHSAGRGINNGSGGTVTVAGTVTGGTAGIGAYNESGGSLTVTEAIGNGYGPGSAVANSVPGVYGSATAGAVTRVYKATSGAYGQYPTAGAVKIVADATNKHTWKDAAGVATGLAYPFASYPSLLTNLVAYWALDGDGTDATGRGNDLTNSGASWVAGKIGQAADLEAGESDYLYRASTSDLQTGPVDWHFVIWLKPEDVSAGTNFAYARKDDGATAREWVVYQSSGAGAGKPYAGVFDGVNVLAAVAWTYGLSSGFWYMLDVSHNAATKTLSLRVNAGTPVTATYTGTAYAGAAPFELGRLATFYYDGIMDMAGFWKGRVLSDAEIAALYNSTPDIELVP